MATEPPGTEPAATEPPSSESPTSEAPTSEAPTDSVPTDSTPPEEDPYEIAPEITLPTEVPTELVRTVLTAGDAEGRAAEEGDLVNVYYRGVLSTDGTEFDSNYGTGTPFTVTLGSGGVVDGWEEGLTGARPGDRLQLDIPSDLGYGEEGSPPDIPPDAALSFVIDVVDVIAAPNPELPEEAPTELVRTVVTEGSSDGREAADGDIVSVYYRGVLTADGTEYDSNFGAPSPLAVTIGSGGQIPGWEDGLIGARPGDRLQLDIPADLAYGDVGDPNGLVPPGSAVTLVMDVVDVTPAPEPEIPEDAPEELVRTVVSEGPSDGLEVQEYDTVTTNYRVYLIEGDEPGLQVDSNFEGGTPTPVIVGQGQAIDGLEDGLIGAKPGDRLQLDIPAELGYGAEGNTELGIPADAPLTYIVDIVDIVRPPEFELPEAAPEELGRTVLTEGDPEGRAAQKFDTVTLDYVMVLTDDGKVVTSSFGVDQPATITLGQPSGLEGLDEGLPGARPGDVVQLDIPSDMAFGEEGSGEEIPPDAALTMVAEIQDVTGPPLVDIPDAVPTELVVTELTAGTGDPAADGDTVFVDYTGVLSADGTRVATNYQLDPIPVMLGSGESIAGLEQGLVGATTGAQLQLDIPGDLAYGAEGVAGDDIPADAALSFLIDVVAVVPAGDEAGAPTDLELPVSEEPVTELVIDDVVEGQGAELTAGSTGYADLYVVCASTGELVASSWGEPQRVQLPMTTGALMDGLYEGLLDMKAGGQRIISVPAAMALGDSGSLDLEVGGDRDLIFVVNLHAVVE